ncbi:MAG: NrdJb [Pseudomonadota bacterium]
MTTKIAKKIVKFSVVKDEPPVAAAAPVKEESTLQHMHEKYERPEQLIGVTYKLKTPLSEHALYVTVNDVILNPGTAHEVRRPFEIFINSKNMDHFQWIVALTRIVSAVFRKGGDVTFLVEELKAVFDPRGGYFKRGGKYMPSLVAEIGDVIEQHMRSIGMINDGLDDHQKNFIAAKRAEYENKSSAKNSSGNTSGDFPATAVLCSKCSTKAMIAMDGCLTCLNCGDSKCG